ncbi:ERMES complex subunit MMM1 [Lachancea thermotolerans CBS 6340]|uniref:Maintenance of mitochondrial morphology protein 1 n=1 Tax=Lachancea thermotolerans (strain ATCC 56472 / CBS 6340 / NRRL Y-8284) TaxID=559295 RepID=MMM1_LACTC|nr:KLTH0B03234p [Lachancea thermotolerans CBS 6340]C5DCI0.1 RecName: Full=Maintenance of mitochondrial morphology protein 1 [Lachancea thermotolerans CBS 6340]CAR21491.1 KLTH0B03234p [Lachancea thermotolerans CBS 6340]
MKSPNETSFTNHTLENASTFGADLSIESNESLVSLDEYLSNTLPLHLQQLFLENLQKRQQGILESASDSIIEAVRDSSQQKFQNGLHLSLDSGVGSKGSVFSAWSFAQGLVIGQLSVIVVLIFFIKFFIFSEGPIKTEGPKGGKSGPKRDSAYVSPLLSTSTSHFLSSIIKRGESDGADSSENTDTDRKFSQINTILEKTYYNVETHSPETLDWFNVLIGQTIQQFREEALQKDNIVHSLNNFIARKSGELPQYLDTIKITELDIGEDFPILSNCRIQYSPNSNKQRLEAKIDIDLSDRLALGIETKLLVNYPKPFTAALPIQLTVSIVRFQACLTVSLTTAEEFVPTSENEASYGSENGGYFLMFSFSPEYRMEFDVKSLIGARSKLQDIPKIGSLIESQIKKWFVERCVEPRFQFIKLPSLWPRSKNTREEKTENDDISMKSTDL